MNYLIIGNGVAGMEAANAIRKNDPDGGIRMVSASPHPHYYRPRVIEYLADEVPLEKLFIYKKDHYEKNRIESILDTEIESIDVDGRAAIDTGGKRHPYDRLLLATGAYSFIPPLKGAELQGVFTLRGISDADRIKRYCAGVSRVAVIGGGLLGLEAAHSLCKLGKKVTVIEFCRWLLPRQLDMQGGAILMKMLEEKGLSFVLDDSVLSIEGNGKVEKVALKSGMEIAAGAVLVSAGIRCRLDLARKSGIAVNNGIIVDDRMATSADGIYAAGDIRRAPGRALRHLARREGAGPHRGDQHGRRRRGVHRQHPGQHAQDHRHRPVFGGAFRRDRLRGLRIRAHG